MIGGEDDELGSYIDALDGVADPSNTSTVDTSDKGGSGGDTGGTPDVKSGKTGAEADKTNDRQQQLDPKAKKPDQSGSDPKSTQNGQQATKPKITRTPSGNLLDEKGNIVDEQGQILVPNGKARRIYEDNARITRDNQRLTEQLGQLQLQSREVQLLNGIPQRYGLNNDDVAQALDMAGRMKRGDVLGVAKDVIALISARGHNISELLGAEVGDSIDMRAVRQMLDERLGPIQQREQQNNERSQAQQQAERDYQHFVDSNDYAEVHGNAIVDYAKKSGVNIQTAYNRLKDFAYENGFDFSQPLGPQIEERMSGSQQQQEVQQQQVQTQRPLPGNGAHTRTNGGVNNHQPAMADPDASWGEIIGKAMEQERNTSR